MKNITKKHLRPIQKINEETTELRNKVLEILDVLDTDDQQVVLKHLVLLGGWSLEHKNIANAQDENLRKEIYSYNHLKAEIII
jgi:hypothetical protein